MARALSAPHGESHAYWLTPWAAFQQHLPAPIAVVCRAEPQRCILLFVAILLAAVGIAVPHLSDESLATFLFLAGASLAALFCFPWQADASARQTTHPHLRTNESVRQVRLPELTDRTAAHPTLDLERWARLTAHMSHELRTPLNAVLGFSEMMSNEVLGPLGSSCYASYARDIHASGRVLLKSAEDALAITALLTSPETQGSPATCQLDAVAEEALRFAEYDIASKGGSAVCNIAPGTAIVGDPQATRQMLINLIAEATRNAHDGREISLEASQQPGFTRLSIAVVTGARIPAAEEGFAMILARTLCELSGAHLTTASKPDGRIWTVDFLSATQNDLFQFAE